MNPRSSVQHTTHDATRLVNHDEITFSVLVKYLDGLRRDRRLVTMNNIFDAIPVLHYRVRLGDLAIDSSDARLECVSLQHSTNTTPPLLRQPTYPTKKKREKERIKTTHNTRSSDPGIQ